MLQAVEAIKEGTLGLNEASRSYQVPRSTLRDRITGRVTHGEKSGPKPYLSSEEEKELVTFLKQAASIGYGKTKKEVLAMVQKTVEKKGVDTEKFNGEGWWSRFMSRNPKLSLRTADPLSKARADAVTQDKIDKYFKLLESTLEEHDLADKPHRIYNVDESGMPLEHKQPKRVAERGTKKVYGRSSGNKAQITIVACASATGVALPPMVIFQGARLNYELTIGEVPGTLYGLSEKGWIDQTLFFRWFNDVFTKHISPARPVLLMLDGHSTHYTPEVVHAAAKQGVVMLCLPPHTTHCIQPLDVSFFKSLKAHWSTACHGYMVNNPGRVVTKFQFSTLFKEAWFKAIKPETFISGFRKTGVYPLNPLAISVPASEFLFLDTSSSSNDLSTISLPSLDDMSEISDDPPISNPDCATHVYTSEQIRLFKTRYENGFDVFMDTEYLNWLRLNHPEDDQLLQGATCGEVDPSGTSQNDSSVEKLVYFEDDGGGPEHVPQSSATTVSENHPSTSRVLISSTPKSKQPSTTTSPFTPASHSSTSAEIPSTPNLRRPGTVSVPQSSAMSTTASENQPSTSGVLKSSTTISPITAASHPSTSAETPSTPNSRPPGTASVLPTIPTPTILSSAITEFLTTPVGNVTNMTKKRKTAEESSARVLTSAQSLAMLKEKQRQKKEEEEEKERRKKERELRKQRREAEKLAIQKRKEERESKRKEREAEKMKKAEEREAEKVKKAKEREAKKGKGKEKAEHKQKAAQKVQQRKALRKNLNDVQLEDISSHQCAVCFGSYDDDLVDGDLIQSWIQCTHLSCSKWMHVDCLDAGEGGMICPLCDTLFL